MAKKRHKYLTTIVNRVRQVLLDEFSSGGDLTDLDWKDDALKIYIGECLEKLSFANPYMKIEVKTTIANSKIIDISDIDDLMWIEKLEYPTGNDPRDYRNFIRVDNETIEIDTGTTPSAGASSTLTGTVTFTSGSAAVTGSGTDFDGELAADYHIRKGKAGSTGRWYRVYSVTDDTNLVLAEPCRADDDGADTVSLTEYCYETVYVYCAKPHTLTDDESTITPHHANLLVMGASGMAAMSKSRSLINTINIGGGRTPSDMYNWGVGQMSLFNAGLKAFPPRVYKQYPK